MEIDFWFDFSSPYCYPVAMTIEEAARDKDLQVNWHGFMLGTILKSQGSDTLHDEQNRARLAYTWLDMKRVCEQYNLAFVRPCRFPSVSRLATRILCWYQHQDWIPAFVRAVFHAAYAQDKNIADEKVIADCIALAGQDPLTVIEQANSMEAKARLHLQNQQAIRTGVFDAPFFQVQQEPFCGLDRMPMALDWHRYQSDVFRQTGTA
ncbi:2-hydroxychromene-2-carboxylate isomerase [Lacimicrobium alkaliphilum]|uniref:2-hydroxychromene-2-carboxylate isomerase n=1 Tax=Lacimicrobium alkaliphilum TaxID=1526571 RepID=A0ABQ1RCB3_9ALTE|nr:2-hydroxychromene-2-carboxylate isomerase [Lacimicrobium alkaliphilum]GGD65753.1 2-hydroxychromene-2-carboxylate isomerase [Lacimicrobium alkaliphilum]